MTNLKLPQNSVYEIFNPNALFFSLLRGATWYYNAFYILFTYFASFIGYEDVIIEVISNFHFQGVIFGQKSFKKLNSAEFMDFVFSKSEQWGYIH